MHAAMQEIRQPEGAYRYTFGSRQEQIATVHPEETVPIHSESAVRTACDEPVCWFVARGGFEKLDAYQLLTWAGEPFGGGTGDLNHSLVAGVKKTNLSW